ncbi:MAG: Ig-like domain-containing protein [Betaproteobacteria bacterium]|nr:Ig-like domain-containing protein [Betaproteobacteria bacterium]MCL2885906.1 Ig-like domain-containing protein [Betaproteobacteria bacterium]
MNTHQNWNEVTQINIPADGVIEASERHTDFVIHAKPSDVANYAREGSDLVLSMRDGANVSGTTSSSFVVDATVEAPTLVVTDNVEGGIVNGPIPDNGLTNDNRPTLSGLAEAGATVHIDIDGVKVDVTADSETGVWSYVPGAALADGAHNVIVSQTDLAGNTSGGTGAHFKVDTEAPGSDTLSDLDLYDDVGDIQGTIVPGGETDDNLPEYSGKAESEVVAVDIYDGDSYLGRADVVDGHWRFTPKVPLIPGDHSFTARPIDAAGNIGEGTPPWDFKLVGDALAAPATTLVVDDSGSVTGPIEKGATTDDTTPTVSGAGTPGNGQSLLMEISGMSGGEGDNIPHGKASAAIAGDADGDVLESSGGNDTFNLIHVGHDTLLYNLLVQDDPTGGNGHDQVNGFTVGPVDNSAPDSDRIDISQLLVGYTPDADGPAHYVDGVAVIDAGDHIMDYLKAEQSGGNTTILINLDGDPGGEFAPLITLNGVEVSLETLLANHQIVV